VIGRYDSPSLTHHHASLAIINHQSFLLSATLSVCIHSLGKLNNDERTKTKTTHTTQTTHHTPRMANVERQTTNDEQTTATSKTANCEQRRNRKDVAGASRCPAYASWPDSRDGLDGCAVLEWTTTGLLT